MAVGPRFPICSPDRYRSTFPTLSHRLGKIVDKLNSEINAALADPKIKARLADLGATVLPGSPADFAKLIADDTEKWGKVIRAANIKRSDRRDLGQIFRNARYATLVRPMSARFTPESGHRTAHFSLSGSPRFAGERLP